MKRFDFLKFYNRNFDFRKPIISKPIVEMCQRLSDKQAIDKSVFFKNITKEKEFFTSLKFFGTCNLHFK